MVIRQIIILGLRDIHYLISFRIVKNMFVIPETTVIFTNYETLLLVFCTS